MPRHQDAVDFLRALAAGVPSEPASFMHLWQLGTRLTSSFLIQDPLAVTAATTWSETPRDLYVSVAMGSSVLDPYRRLSNATTAGIYGTYLDVDVAGPGHVKGNLPPDLDAALDLIDEFGAPPTIALFSGHGLQLWWLLRRAWLFADADDAASAATLAKGWVNAHRSVAQGHGWDHDAVGDLARLLRVPGTINAKVAEQPVDVDLVLADGPRYDVKELAALIDAHPASVTHRSRSSSPGSQQTPEVQPEATFSVAADAEPPAEKLALLLLQPPALASWNHDRTDFSDQSPSTYDMSLASLAVSAGWSDQEVVDLLIACRRHNQSPRKLRQDYFQRTLNKARCPDGDDPADDEADLSLFEKIKANGLIPVLADLLEDEHVFARDGGGVLYRFNEGRYVEAGSWLELQSRVLLEEGDATKHWRRAAAADLAGYLGAVAPRLWDWPPRNVLNVANGLLDLDSGELLPHSPSHLSSDQLPVTFDPEADCPRIDQFVRETFPRDAFSVAAELIAFVMVPDPSIQKAVLLLGPGGNGKSVWLRAMEAFLGPDSYSTVPLHKLESDRFSSSRLQGKRANICPDLPASDLKGSSVFKGLTGGDTIIAERKYFPSYDMRTRAKLIFSANTPPRSPDASDAFFQRWFVVPFDRVFRGEVTEIASHRLDEMLQEPRELSGLLNQAVAALPGLRARGLSEPLSCVEAREKFRAVTDPVSVWIHENTLSVPGAFVPKAQLVQQYNFDASRGGHPTLSAIALGKELRRTLPGLDAGQRRLAGRTVEVWRDVIVRPRDRASADSAQSGVFEADRYGEHTP